jgi:S-DNA-T family DNA segregation ATPase FtsK/SpoIIIE
LGTPNLIIETPIPGKAVLGIQVPNKKSAVVKLGNILKEKEFSEGSLFTFPVGRKINGEAYFADLAKMPHLLIAGTTGSGKSIFIHNILISFLMKNSPDTLNLILIDPKRVELITYSDLPHLIMDPIIDVKKTLAVFNWLIEEMEERYKLLQESKSRDINSYNQKQIIKKDKLMPRIVLVIDELADLMITFGANIESMIIRLTQMARATGIHLILATQRPSVDIVTGLIKANIPNRICFKVASYVDSRTVLDISGAEKLMGTGDGLFISTSTLRPLRIKAPYVSENEIAKVIKFWSDQAEELPQFEKQTIPLEEIEKKTVYLQENEDDDYLLKEAIEIILEANKASTSLLQRRLKIGYARAARILDLLEQKGIVGPQEGSKPRKILITKEELDNF